MNFRIAYHAAASHAPPPGALELLFERLGPRRGEVSFRKAEHEILATWRGEAPIAMTQDERVETGRRVVLDILLRICRSAPDLDADWFAISPRR
ncbi:MAG: hypothetical protein KGJ43_09785 [Acidobacteriota bacterium]|nr:hypothetical protein [Acidobacteriota bacterium]